MLTFFLLDLCLTRFKTQRKFWPQTKCDETQTDQKTNIVSRQKDKRELTDKRRNQAE